MELERCVECNDWTEPTSRCLNCKRNDYYRRKGILVDLRCKSCLAIKKLYSNSECRKCLRQAGMQECTICHEVAISLLDFKKKQSICKRCRHPLGHLSRKERGLHMFYMRKYGISYEEYRKRYEAQGGVCLICGNKPKTLVVDHDHTTKEVRGLLCSNCNTGLGMFKDSAELLIAGANYIGTSKKG